MWTIEAVAERFSAACATLRRLPDGEAKYRRGARAVWPDVVAASLASTDPGRPRLGPPSPQAIDQMYQAIDWLSWLTEPQRRITWAIASGIPAARLARMIGCHRNTVANRHAVALLVVAGRLNSQPALALSAPSR